MGSLKMLAFLGRKQRTSRKTTETLAFRVESEAKQKRASFFEESPCFVITS
jgi:hypothetical protein